MVHFGSNGIKLNFTLEEKSEIKDYLKIGCNLNSSKSCRYLAAYLRTIGEVEEAYDVLMKAVNTNFVDSKVYHDLANYHSSGQYNFTLSKEIIIEYLKEACQKTHTMCSYYGWVIDKANKCDVAKKMQKNFINWAVETVKTLVVYFYFIYKATVKLR